MYRIKDEQIDQWIEAHKEQMLEDICELIRIRSVSAYDPNSPERPFGEGCAKVLLRALELCERRGFRTRNYDFYCGTAVLPGTTSSSIGIFNHLDVVPEGNGWSFDPFSPFVRDGVLFGRGSMDNKGAAVMSLYTMMCLRELAPKLKHSLILCLGCNEEAGMKDIRHYLECEPAPAFSYTPDAGLPVCNGEKGILEADLIQTIEPGNLLALFSGMASNMVPDKAYAELDCTLEEARAALSDRDGITIEGQNGRVRVTAHGIGGHAAFPENTVNAEEKLLCALLESGLLQGGAAEPLAFLQKAFADDTGVGLGIDFRDEPSGYTTHVGGMVRLEGRELRQNVNIRYVVTADPEEVERRLCTAAEQGGFRCVVLRNSPPSYMPGDHPAVQVITRVTNEVLHTDLKPFTMGGGTYARELPNAVAFGPNRMDLKLPEGVGDGHQADEGVCVQYLLDGLKIYVKALLELDEVIESD